MIQKYLEFKQTFKTTYLFKQEIYLFIYIRTRIYKTSKNFIQNFYLSIHHPFPNPPRSTTLVEAGSVTISVTWEFAKTHERGSNQSEGINKRKERSISMVGILLSSRLTSSPSPTTNTDLLLRGRPSTNTGENICRACWSPHLTTRKNRSPRVYLDCARRVTHPVCRRHTSFFISRAQEYPSLHDGSHFPPLSDVDNVPR